MPTQRPGVGRGVDRLYEAIVELYQPGMLMPFAGAAAPAGWLLADGSIVPEEHTDLIEVLTAAGSPYGTGSGRPRLPDMRGRAPVGVDGDAGRLTANDALGNAGGEEKHTLTQAEIPDHQHAISVNGTGDSNVGLKFVIDAIATGRQDANYHATGPLGTGSSTGIPVPDGGGDGPHNNMPPYLVLNWLVKT